MRGIVWFRRDLRLHDQPALAAACKDCDDVIPLFVFDDTLLKTRVFGSACVNFMLGCLQELSDSLAALGLPLRWRRGEPVEELLAAAREWKADAVYWNRDYEPAAIERDRTVQRRLAKLGVAVRTFKDHVVFEAEEVRGATGGPLQRYGAYRARWWAKWRSATPALLPPPRPRAKMSPAHHPPVLPGADQLAYEKVTPWIEPGERRARERLRWFLDGPVHDYAKGRNRPALDGSSRLSPHFRFGTLSARAAIHEALEVLGTEGRGSKSGVLTWIDELIWRDFFQQVLTAFPDVVDGPFRPGGSPPPRRAGKTRDRLFRAWCDGMTGFPIVDAGMRQLNQTGWMHNRVRMIVASFLVKDLRIDWQSGERYFMQHLLDADVAANNGNWQWCASTGADAMPGYRIFNPALQSKKFDPEGSYIRAYVPELAEVGNNRIHEPHLMTKNEQARSQCRIGKDYPVPIVDHSHARDEYLSLARRKVKR